MNLGIVCAIVHQNNRRDFICCFASSGLSSVSALFLWSSGVAVLQRAVEHIEQLETSPE